jgi:hypothetical protein
LFGHSVRIPEWQSDKLIGYAVGNDDGLLSFQSEALYRELQVALVRKNTYISGSKTSRHLPEAISAMIKGILPRLFLLTACDLFAKDRVNDML